MEVLRALVLGLVQGLTEFIPISSSAHLVVVPWLFGWQDAALTSLQFDVALHLGTLLAVLSFFAADWVRLIRGFVASIVQRRIGPDADRRLAWFLVVGCIPGGVAGVGFESKIEALFHRPGQPIQPAAMLAMAVIIALLGLALYLAERTAVHCRPLRALGLRDAVIVGLAQAFAIFPGVSRSGSTITAGLALGLERDAAARFSFLLSAPIIAGAGAKSALDVLSAARAGTLPSGGLSLFAVGFVAATVSGYLTIKYLLRYLQDHSTIPFVYYRWALAALLVAVVLFRR